MSKEQCGHQNGPWKCQRPEGHKGQHGCGTRLSTSTVKLEECLLKWRDEPEED